jgi:hypothetical protein
MITTAVMSRRKRSEHYVNNEEFLNALIDYQNKVELSFIQKYGREPTKSDRGTRWDTKPPIPRYVGECFLKMSNHLAFKPNFVNYMFKDDMICDGIENCVQYIHNFNPERSRNPFAYFTQIIHYAFLRRIKKEKKQLEIKNKILERTGFDQVFESGSIDGSDHSDYNSIKDAVHQKLRY